MYYVTVIALSHHVSVVMCFVHIIIIICMSSLVVLPAALCWWAKFPLHIKKKNNNNHNLGFIHIDFHASALHVILLTH